MIRSTGRPIKPNYKLDKVAFSFDDKILEAIKPNQEYRRSVRPGDVPSDEESVGSVRYQDGRDSVVVTSPKPTLSLKNEVDL